MFIEEQRQINPFVWVRDFSDESLLQFYEDFSRLELDNNAEIIPVIISSYGGETSALMAMRDLIKSCHKPVATIALGKAMSCGALLLATGSDGLRFCGPSTEIMLHEVSWGSEGKTSDMKWEAKQVEQLNKRVYTNFAKDIGQSYSEIEKILASKNNADVYMTPDEALKIGLVNHIVVPRLANIGSVKLILNSDQSPAEAEAESGAKRKPKKPKAKAYIHRA